MVNLDLDYSDATLARFFVGQFGFINEHHWDTVPDRVATLTLADTDEFLCRFIVLYSTFTCRTCEDVKQSIGERIRVFGIQGCSPLLVNS